MRPIILILGISSLFPPINYTKRITYESREKDGRSGKIEGAMVITQSVIK
jgi:hypothetical protein